MRNIPNDAYGIELAPATAMPPDPPALRRDMFFAFDNEEAEELASHVRVLGMVRRMKQYVDFAVDEHGELVQGGGNVAATGTGRAGRVRDSQRVGAD